LHDQIHAARLQIDAHAPPKRRGYGLRESRR